MLIEVSIKSGTLITGKYAIDYNREVIDIPGSSLDQNSNEQISWLKKEPRLGVMASTGPLCYTFSLANKKAS